MTEPLLQSLSRVSDFLEQWGRPAAVIGGIAVVAHTRARPTRDVDVVITVEEGREEALLATARRCGLDYDEDETREFIEGGLVRLWGPPSRAEGFGLDLLFVDSDFLERVVGRARPIDLVGVSLDIATPEDLLLLKLEANRPIDVEDVIALKDAFGAELDRDYLDARAGELGVAERLSAYLD